MKPALIITHMESRRAGLVRQSFAAAGRPVLDWNPLEGAPPPALEGLAGIVSLGGRASATQVPRDEHLQAEVRLLQEGLAKGVPILGLCLGAQLLAVAAGGRVRAMERMYVGWAELSLLPAAREDPLFSRLPSGLATMKWHEDMIQAPDDALVLGETPGTPGTALFRAGPAAWGSQMHLEVDAAMLIDGWMSGPRGIAELTAAGYDADAFRAQSARRLEVQMAAARPVFDRFAEIVGDQRLWLTASMLLPSGSSANAA
ncbi:MAG TPA: type 1 glutamine amidotransferase [Solirubrobacteraceae bacterium]